MSDIPTLLVSEYGECRRLQYDDLVLGTQDFRHIHASFLEDNGKVQRTAEMHNRP
jgi:hypothetical protein